MINVVTMVMMMVMKMLMTSGEKCTCGERSCKWCDADADDECGKLSP